MEQVVLELRMSSQTIAGMLLPTSLLRSRKWFLEVLRLAAASRIQVQAGKQTLWDSGAH